MSEPSNNPGYERSDAGLKPLLLFAAALVVLIALALWSMSALESGFERSHDRENVAHPLQDLRVTPAAPQLQAWPTLELAEQRVREYGLLEEYAWVDPENGVVRIPIERAMALIAERGLPERSPKEEER